IEPAKEPGRSRIRLEPQFLEDGGAAGTFQFDIDGEALDMRRLDEKVLVLMDREEDNIDAYSLEGRFLWNIGEKLPVHRRYDNLYEDTGSWRYTFFRSSSGEYTASTGA
ncbi:MAG: hypothetical protein E6X19_31215, partial [Hungatella hathewayi]|nr:hypothetical protein [Hungatella hathewayi]